MTGSNRGKRQRLLLASVLFAAAALGCGSRMTAGNTGSETHWLKSCTRDADCGSYSCYCGVCSRSCSDDAECNEVARVASYCAEPPAGERCETDTPQRVCVKGAAPSSPWDAGDETSSHTEASSESESSDTNATLEPRICDGSDDIRFIYNTSGGQVSGDYAFTGRYGWSFVAIDGLCNFWGSSSLGRVVTGTLTSRAPLADYESSEFGRLNRFDDVEPSVGCLDGGSALVWDPSGAAEVLCGPTAGGELAVTFGKANLLVNEVLRQGARSESSLRLLILQAFQSSGEGVEWPLDLDPSNMFPEERPTYEEMSNPLAGIQFPKGDRATALRSVIGTDGPTLFQYASTPPVQFRAVLRDDVPPKVLAALELARLRAAFKQDVTLGQECSTSETCTNGLSCQERSAKKGGGAACNTCVTPNDPEWLCRTNEDCCGNLVCCVDCGEKSGTCIADEDPCEACLDNGSRWVMPDTCDPEECIPDTGCYSSTCPGPCDSDNCEGCGREQECWAAGCDWNASSAHEHCEAPRNPGPSVEPCDVTVSDETLPLIVHLETDSCTFFRGMGGQFRYRVELLQSVDFTTESSGGSCGRCGEATDVGTWTEFTITGDGLSYCPECDVGCCPPTEAVEASVAEQTIEGVIDWPGLQWNGPSDTDEPPEGEFPPGEYSATLTVSLPGVGAVSATLPIYVRPSLQQ